ncbi:MAG: hypothetical protein QW231_04580, partial [Candidatus Bathyarchaeia archaeon]
SPPFSKASFASEKPNISDVKYDIWYHQIYALLFKALLNFGEPADSVHGFMMRRQNSQIRSFLRIFQKWKLNEDFAQKWLIFPLSVR